MPLLWEDSDTTIRHSAPAKWMALLEAEYENIETTIHWLLNHQPERVVKLGAFFWRYHLRSGLLLEGLEMIRKLLPLSQKNHDLQGLLLVGAGTLSHNLGNYLEAKQYFVQSLTCWETSNKTTEIVRTLNNLGWAEWRLGNYDLTISYSEQALRKAAGFPNQQSRAKSLNNIAWINFCRGFFEQAMEVQSEVLQIHIQANNLRGITFANINLARALLRIGKLSMAKEMINECINTFTTLKDQQLLTFLSVNKSRIPA